MQPNYNFYGVYPYQQQYNQIITVNSLEDVNNYIVHYNRPVYFKINGEKPLIIEKKVDMNGIASMEIFELSKNQQKVEYVTVEDFNILKQEIFNLKAFIEGKQNE